MIRILLSFILMTVTVHAADYRQLSTLGTIDGIPTWIKCPVWDWELVPPECRQASFNCIPVCGKWPGDLPDIGAYEYIPGATSEKPWGIWEGIPLSYVPGEGVDPPQNVVIK